MCVLPWSASWRCFYVYLCHIVCCVYILYVTCCYGGCVSVSAPGSQRLTTGVLITLSHGLWVSLKLIDLARLVGQWALGIFQSLLPAGTRVTDTQHCRHFMQVLEIWTQIPRLQLQALYRLSHPLIPKLNTFKRWIIFKLLSDPMQTTYSYNWLHEFGGGGRWVIKIERHCRITGLPRLSRWRDWCWKWHIGAQCREAPVWSQIPSKRSLLGLAI